MSTKEQITTAIDTKIRNKTPLVVKVEHADVEQLITDEMFPNSVKVEWNGTAAVDPTTNVIVSGSLSAPDNVKFKIYFWKQGNSVYFNGTIESLSSNFALEGLLLITFPTTLYKPLTNSKIRVNILNSVSSVFGKNIITVDSGGVYIDAGLPPQISSIISTWGFNGTYKVAN